MSDVMLRKPCEDADVEAPKKLELEVPIFASIQQRSGGVDLGGVQDCRACSLTEWHKNVFKDCIVVVLLVK